MASSTQSTPKLTASFFAHRETTHLSWQDLRLKVLSPRRIVLHDASSSIRMPSDLLAKIQTNLNDLERFDEQRADFRLQVETGCSFGDSPVWPPNSLPWLAENSKVQRVTSPKLSRETLPVRGPTEQGQLFDLPTPRPALACGFDSEAFTEIELSNLPSPLTTSGTVIDFSNGLVATSVPIHCPFLLFGKVKGLTEQSIESAKNECALSGAACVRGLQLLYNRAFGGDTKDSEAVALSCTMDNSIAIINYHWLSDNEQYNMTPICKFDLTNDDHFNNFQAWIEGIEDWAVTRVLPKIKRATQCLASSIETPPLSPMPSLSLSVDTSGGVDDKLMKALRSMFSSIKWRYQGVGETPIMSSIAQCGTPLPTRYMRSLALVTPITPASPVDARSFQAMKLKIPCTPISPGSRKFEMSPLRISFVPPDSPARPGTLSPCSPPIDAPFGPTRPILVVQKRLEHALDEIRELRTELNTVQQELKLRRMETKPATSFPALEAVEQLVKRVELIERERALVPIPGIGDSLSYSAKTLAGKLLVRLKAAFQPKYFTMAASILTISSIWLVGRLLGYRLVESVSRIVTLTSLSRPQHLVSRWMPTIFYDSNN